MAHRVDEKADTAGQAREHAWRNLAIRADDCRRGLHAGEAAVGIEIAGVGLEAHDPAWCHLPIVAELKAGEECSRVDLVTEYRRSFRIGECCGACRCTGAAAGVEARPCPGRCWGRELKSAAAASVAGIKADTINVAHRRCLLFAYMATT